MAAPDAERVVARLPDRAGVRLRLVVVARLAVRDRGGAGPACVLRHDGAPPRAPRHRPPWRRHGAALLCAPVDGPGREADEGIAAPAAAGILSPVLRRHRTVRGAARGALCAGLLRPGPRAVRHRRAAWPSKRG